MRGLLRKLLFVALALVVLGALAYRSRRIINLQDFSWDRLVLAVRHARGSLLLVSLLAIYAAYAIRALRWARFCRYLGRPGFLSIYSATLVGFAALFLLGRAGEPIRPLVIARKERLPVSSMFGIYVLERLFDTTSTAVLAGLALLFFPEMLSLGGADRAWEARARGMALALFAGLLAALVFLVYFRLHGAAALERRLEGWRTSTGWKRGAAAAFAGFSEGLQAIQTLPDLLAAIGYSASHWIVVALIFFWVPHSFGGRLAKLDFAGAMLLLAITMVGSTLQLPAVGGGSQAASFLALTVVFGVEKEPAAAASIVLWLMAFAASSLVGVPLLIREGWSMGELRRLARAEAEVKAAGAHIDVPEAPRAQQATSQKLGEPPR